MNNKRKMKKKFKKGQKNKKEKYLELKSHIL
jgi:hypothetical protein